MLQDTQQQIRLVRQELVGTLSSFAQDNFNTIPFEGSWTAAQVSEHIVKYGSWILDTVKGASKPPERAPDAMSKNISDIFLNFDIKFNSPAFIEPGNDHLQLTNQLNLLKDICDGLLSVSNSLDLNELCTTAELPTVGLLTRLEWFNFFIVHTQRHIHQLRNILAKLP